MVMTFSVIPVGHLSMPGPMNITYPDTVGENEDNRTVLAHWNTCMSISNILKIFLFSFSFAISYKAYSFLLTRFILVSFTL